MSKDKAKLTRMASEVAEEKNARKVIISVCYTDDTMTNSDIKNIMDALDASLDEGYQMTIEK